MYVTTAPAASAASDPGPADPGGNGRVPLPLTRVISRRFDASGPYSKAGLQIISDLAASYGLAHVAEPFAAAERTTFTEMVATLVDELTDEEDPVGLVVLAHGVADAEPQWPACYLAGRLPGEPLAFAVADDGITTPFLALRIAGEYLRTEGFRRAAVIILDQPALLRGPEGRDGAPSPTENRMVALVFGGTGALGTVSVRLTADTAPEAAARAVLAWTGAADPDGSQSTTILGGALAAASGIRPGPAAVVAPTGQPCTGVWAELAAGLEHGLLGGREVVLADYDPVLRLYGECRVRPAAGTAPQARR